MQIAFTFPLKAGLHARPAARLQDLANRYLSTVTFRNKTNGSTASAKSTLALVSTLTRFGDQCLLTVEGEDQGRAFIDVRDFVTDVLPHADDELPPVSFPARERPFPRMLRDSSPLQGVPVSPGLAMGRAAAVRTTDVFTDVPKSADGNWEDEEAKLVRAIGKVAEDIERSLAARSRRPEKAILQAHLSILRDKELHDRIVGTLRAQPVSVGAAVAEAATYYGDLLSKSDNAYLQERAVDIRDVTGRIVTAIYGSSGGTIKKTLGSDAICIAENLTPSEFLSLGANHLRAVVLAHGGATSHTVILARAQGVPCVTGVRNALSYIPDGEEVLVDAERGLIFLRPDTEVRNFYKIEFARQEKAASRVSLISREPACTAEGKRIEIGANASSIEDVRVAMRNGAEGIGVFRTEILFLDRATPPSEDEQTKFYTGILNEAGDKPVILRTLDIGGDKPVPSIPLPQEENPFLGYRAIRMYADHSDLIDSQIRGMLRASATGLARIMFPMVSTVTEVMRLKERVRRCMDELHNIGIPFNSRTPIGIMIEVPGVLFQMDRLCAEVDFFSVGTNDLTQYFFAADRGNERVSNLYNPFHPAFLRGLRMIIESAHRHGRWVGICGEMAGVPAAVPVLVGLGFDELSVSPVLVSHVKADLRTLPDTGCATLTKDVLVSDTPEEVQARIQVFLRTSRQFDLVDVDIVDLAAQGSTKAEIIRELVALLQLDGRLENADEVEEAVWRREDTYATGMGNGIAMPHCKTSSVRVASIAVAKLSTPILWNPPEDPVSLVILVAIPGDGGAESHLNIIAHLARNLVHEEFREALMKAVSPEKVVSVLRGTVDES
jgi:phosphoenolpyruvate-protein phosphotransferase